MIDLSENQLQGRLPKSLTNCNNLEVLDVGRNHIDDFPPWLGSLPKLHILILRENNFHGKITSPKASLYFRSLRIVDFSKNFLSGDLPLEYLLHWDSMKITMERQSTTSRITTSLSTITPKGIFLVSEQYNYSITITNEGNNMMYTKILKIPDVIEQLRGLQALNLSHNNLQGQITLSSANMTDLESLDLSNNNLSGEIPQELTKLTSLEVINVSYNLLVGPILQGEQFGAFDESSFVGNLGLCGIPLSKKCRNVDESWTPSTTMGTNDEEHDSDHLIDWIIRGLGCVSGFAAGCALGKYFTDRHHEWFVETFERRRRRRKPKIKVRLAARIIRGRV
ncbi:hypothetical protein Cgig2_004023 [Carnegiea gigantea]|uniref:Uncharacterized protein n=1 Tax=Carnegiea gigantea TaxID=171969 RepID=A0A9Q1KU67_9CARY|nr:hypothetical protein Cgig2_004023 [Carnegiea gigantea]